MSGRLGLGRRKNIRKSPPVNIPNLVQQVLHAVEDRRRKAGPSKRSWDKNDSEFEDENVQSPLPTGSEQECIDDPPGYPAKPDGSNKLLGYSEDTLDMAAIKKWLIFAEKGWRYQECIMSLPPKKPKGGQILLYRCRKEKDLDHHRDEYTGFDMYATNKTKIKQPVYKKYFRMINPDGQIVPFDKYTYELRDSMECENKVVLIHYMGDESSFIERCHKNSKSGRVYTASTRRVLDKIGSELKKSGQNSQAVYDGVVKATLDDDEEKTREAVLAPRNRKQVENIKLKMDHAKRLMRCDIFSLIEMGRNKTLGGFIRRHMVNPFDIVIMAEPSALRFASYLLKAATLDNKLAQCLSYDTTFTLGDAYVSALVARNTLCIGEPLFPVAYMVHERKLEAVHTEFFRMIKEELFLDAISANIPIVTDREIGIINAILTVEPEANVCLCTNHIKQDVKRWVREAGGKGDDIIALKGHIKRLLACETDKEFDEYYSTVELMWSQAFKAYMHDHLHDDIRNRASRWAVNRYEAFKNKEVTNNASESFNFMIKNQNKWTELRIDSLVLSLFNLQLDKMREIERAFKPGGLGEYLVKSEYKSLDCPLVTPSYITYSPDKFLDIFKQGIDRPSENIIKEGNYLQSRTALAKLTCENNLVSLDSKSGCFVVTGVYSSRRLVVRRKDDGTLSCSCNSSGYCYHKLAVLSALNVEITEDKETYSLTILRKKTRSAKKTGRKQPNVEDFVNNVDPAPDSDLVCAKQLSSQRKFSASENELDGAMNDSVKQLPKGTDHILTSPDSSDNEIQVLSSGSHSSSSSKKSFEAIHHYNCNDFVEPGGELFVPRNSLCGARSISTDADFPDDLRLSKTPESLPKSWIENTTYQCLGPKQWIMEDIFNDMSRLMIKLLHMEESVSLVNTHEFGTLLLKKKYSDYVSFALRSQGLNSDVMIINIRASSHFYFAVVAYRRKEIIIVDSMMNNLPGTSNVYRPLLLFVAATYYVGLVEFIVDDWKLILEMEVQEQPNGYDCGPYAIYNQYRLLRKLGLHVGDSFPSSSLLRKWILNCLHTDEAKRSVLLPRSKKVKRLLPKVKHAVELLLEQFDIPEDVLKPQEGSRSLTIIDELKVATQNWFPCAATNCLAAIEDSEFLLCTFCRGWFHLGTCVNEEGAKADYFLCSSCLDKRISLN